MMALELEKIDLPVIDDIEAFIMYVSQTEKNMRQALLKCLE